MKLSTYFKHNWRSGERYRVVVPCVLSVIALGMGIACFSYMDKVWNHSAITSEEDYVKVFGERVEDATKEVKRVSLDIKKAIGDAIDKNVVKGSKNRPNYGNYNADGSPMWKGYDDEIITSPAGQKWIYCEDWNCWQKHGGGSKDSNIQYSEWAKNTPGKEIFGNISVNMGGIQ